MKPFDETKYYLGKLCKRGHDYDGTGKSLRYIGVSCVECTRIAGELYRKNNQVRIVQYKKDYRKKNHNKLYEVDKKYREENPDQCRAYYTKYREENPNKVKKIKKKWAKENSDKVREFHRKQTLELSENYVKSRITSNLKIERDKIPPEMIEIKREQIMLHREIKQYKKEIKDGLTTR